MKIVCIGRNYADHARELGNQIPEEPVLFIKPDSAQYPHKNYYIPDFTKELHYECELVIRIDRVGKHIQPEYAHTYYSQVTLGIDFTARDLQNALKSKGLPWEKAKGFDGAAVVGTFIPKEAIGDINNTDFYFYIDGQLRQHGQTSQMLYSVDQLISYISRFFTLKKGDLIFTGTPAGVGLVMPGMKLKGILATHPVLELTIKG
ncbi:MAG: fumarylacetoacetate hydrolase family protein [Thermaurantimonas sp.]